MTEKATRRRDEREKESEITKGEVAKAIAKAKADVAMNKEAW